jgi:hypothetical protein
MKALIILLSFFLVFNRSIAQEESKYQSVDRTILSIPASQTSNTDDIAAFIKTHFDTDRERIRAAYTWVTTNIKYDTDSIHRVILNEDKEEKVTFALRRRKGICENFAAIFYDLCTKNGIKSYVIEGYTKQNGAVDRTAHVWCSALIDHKWFLYDPTWDAGFVNRGTFVSSTATNYFQLEPADFIQTHMPYDPLFQFSNYPLSYEKFSRGVTKTNSKKRFFNFADSLLAYENMDELTQYLASFQRIKEATNAASVMRDTKLKQLKLETELIYQDRDMALYDSSVDNYNSAIKIFNIFLNYRNNQFRPAKSNEEVTAMFDGVSRLIASANHNIKEIKSSNAVLSLDTGDIQKKLNDLSVKMKEQKEYLKTYLSLAK